MIASQKIGKSFMGALNYNFRKMNHPDPSQRATLLDTNFSSMDKHQISREVDLIRELRPNLNRYVYHTSLNFTKTEDLPDDALLAIAHEYLEALGFNNNQYFIFRHYDADHPHLHLVVNRITFDGEVVSDSNNYKRSEQVLREIERNHDLIPVTQTKNTQLRAATKDELEMVVRTGLPSTKMLLQEVLSDNLKQQRWRLPDFIRQCEEKGIQLLFNQQSTGRISGITYYHDGIKITGQKLGNRFKWAELIKQVDYEQIRDGKAISEANSRTREIYGAGQPANGRTGDRFIRSDSADPANRAGQSEKIKGTGSETFPGRERSLEADQDADTLYRDTFDTLYHDNFIPGIEIADDVDDEAVYGKNRRRQRNDGGYGH